MTITDITSFFDIVLQSEEKKKKKGEEGQILFFALLICNAKGIDEVTSSQCLHVTLFGIATLSFWFNTC